MTTITIFIGSSFDGGQEWNDLEFPTVPRVGEYINQNGRRNRVTAVEYYVGKSDQVLVRVLIPGDPRNFDMEALLE